MTDQPLSVLFLRTGNSARSQMAEALLRKLSRDQIEVHSAGSAPKTEVHPMARAVLEKEYNIDTTKLRTKSLDRFLDRQFDYVITLCDQAAESCPVFPGDPDRIHWSFDDPAIVADEDERRRAFEKAATSLAGRLRIWLSLPQISERLAKPTLSGGR